MYSTQLLSTTENDPSTVIAFPNTPCVSADGDRLDGELATWKTKSKGNLQAP